ncbi:MAG: hypothetical protein IJT38_01235 [Clostridia bacterium]|nr:hypothetical protein [Clostridia bacterium]
MQAIVIVLNKTECLEELMEKLSEHNVRATIISSKGMAHSLMDLDKMRFIESLKILLDPIHKENYTIFSVIDDHLIPEVSKIVNEVTGGLEKSNSGIIFTVPVGYAEGIA